MHLHQIHFVGGLVEFYPPLIALETQIWHYMFSTKLFVKIIYNISDGYNLFIKYLHNLFVIN